MIFSESYNAPEWEEIIETAVVTALSTGLLESPEIIGAGFDNSLVRSGAENLTSGQKAEETEADPIMEQAAEMLKRDAAQKTGGEPLASAPAAATETAQASSAQSKMATTDDPAQAGRKAAESTEEVRSGLQAAARTFGAEGAKNLMDAYDGTVRERDYLGGFTAFYEAGMSGWSMNSVKSIFNGYLTDNQKLLAYGAGQIDAARSLKAEIGNVASATVYGKGAGLVRNQQAAKLDRGVADGLNRLAKATGVKIQVEELAEGINGSYDIKQGIIRLNANASNPLLVVAAHEVTHRMQQMAPKEYRAYRNYAIQAMSKGMGRAAVEEAQKRYGQVGQKLNAEEAMDEVAAEFAEAMVKDEKLFQDLVRENRTVAQKFVDAVKEFIEKIKAVFTKDSNARNSYAVRKYGVDMKTLEAAAKQWEAALRATEQTVKGKENTASEGGVRLSVPSSKDSEYYSYSNLVAQPDMEIVQLPEVQHVRNENGEIVSNVIVDLGMKNAKAAGYADSGHVYVRNDYTGQGLKITRSSIKHGLDGDIRRKLTNARFGAVIGDVVKHAIPINGLKNTAKDVTGTYAMISYASDSRGREFVAVITVEERGNAVSGMEVYDVVHSLSGRQKRDSNRADTKSPGSVPSTNAISKISISDLLKVVDQTHQSILSNDVLAALGETRNPAGYYSDRVLYSLANEGELNAARAKELIEKYGTIYPGETPHRDVQVPRKTAEDKHVSQTVRTVLEAKATPDAAIPKLEEMILNGEFSYERYTDKAAMSDAVASIADKGYSQALVDWSGAIRKGIVSKENTAMGWALYNEAANAGDMKAAMTIITNMIEHQRSAAQAVQATRILKKMSPGAQLYGIQRSVSNLQNELKERFGKRAPELVIDEVLAKRFLDAKTDKARENAMREIYRDIGKQVPSRFVDKWNAWRYLAMLGNPRTHVRNVLGNAGFTPVVATKNVVATALETAFNKYIDRTKGFVGVTKADRDLLKAAWGDFENVRNEILGEGKYGDLAYANKEIEEGRRVFKTKPLEFARRQNSHLLDLEDTWFSKPHYAYALAQYCKAHGLSAERVQSGKYLGAARQYAVKEAQKATYRDLNAFSDLFGRRFSENGRFGKVGKAANTAMEGILPFRKTPANILARGIEYSPLGLLKGLTYDLVQVHQKNMTAAEAIDDIAAGLTGTGLTALGFWLASQGLLRGAGSGDEKEKEFDELQGHQSYALELPDGTSVTLDWLAPEALPFFVGVNLCETKLRQNENPLQMSDYLQAISNVTEPMLEMSCLQGLNDVFDSIGYAASEDTSSLMGILTSAATSYLTQALPSLGGQIERSSEAERMTTYTSKNAWLTTNAQYAIGKASTKIPGFDYGQIPYIDAWGRIEATGALGERTVSNFLNPAYASQIEESSMEKELERVYASVGDAVDVSIFPSRAPKYFNVNKERKDLTAEEYVKYAAEKGRISYTVMTSLVKNAVYLGFDDTYKAESISKVYEYANAVAKMSVSDYQPEGWTAKAIKTCKEQRISVDQYIAAYILQSDVESLKDKNGEPISNSTGLQIMELVYRIDELSTTQRKALFTDFGVGRTVINYTEQQVKRKLGTLRRSKD